MKKARRWLIALSVLSVLTLFAAGCSKGVSQADYDALQAQLTSAQSQNDTLTTQAKDAQQQATDLQTQLTTAQASLTSTQDELAKAKADLAHHTFHVAVGSESQASGTELDSFFPATVTVDEGDTVVFTLNSNEIHTVTFNAPAQLPEAIITTTDGKLALNPQIAFASPAAPPAAPGTPMDLKVSFDGTGYVSSGLMQTVGDTYEVTFTKTGTFRYICLIHGVSMSGTVIVQASGSELPKTPTQVDQQVAQDISAQGAKALDMFNAITPPAPQADGNGHTVYTVYAGAGDMADAIDFMHFFGAEHLTVHVGDTVRFDISKNMPGTPHTITFLSGAPDPAFVVPQPQPNGPPTLLINPDILPPSPMPATPYMGTGFYNSGLMLAGVPGKPQTWGITFGKAGTYPFNCVLHDQMGMEGSITVVP